MPMYCCAYGCKEKFSKGGGITFHAFPKNDTRRKAWEMQLRRENFKATYCTKICSKHFTADCFDTNKFGATWLKPDALPTVFNFTDHLQMRRSKQSKRLSAQNEDVNDKGKEIQKGCKDMKDSYVKAMKMEDGKRDARETKRPYIHQRHMAFLPEINGGRSSETASGEEKKEDRIPVEPTIEIKKEPMDYYATPSTSTDTSNGQFILPHEENPWITPDPVVEPQFTLSVASLSSSYVPETSDDEQLKKKRKTNPSTLPTLAPSTYPPDVKPQSLANSIGESSNPGSSNEPRKDQLDAFGEYIIAKLRSLDWRSSTFAQKAIVDIIFEAEMGKFLKEDCEYKVLKYCAS